MYRRRSRHNEERRKAFYRAFAKTLVAFGLLGVTAYYAYETGMQVVHRDGDSVREQLQEAKADLQDARSKLADGERLLAEAQADAQSFKQLYEQVKPDERIRDLTIALNQRLQEGLAPERLLFAIKWAKDASGCVAQPDRRFAVKTPTYSGPASSTQVRVADSVMLSMTGESGSTDGRLIPFDAQKPVRLTMSGELFSPRAISGTLPIEEIVPVPGGEVRFSVKASDIPGFADVKSRKCGL